MHKEPKKKRNNYMIIAAALLAVGSVARIIVGSGTNIKAPVKNNTSISSVTESEITYGTENIYDITVDDTESEVLTSDSSKPTSETTSSEENTESTLETAAEVIKYALPIKGNITKGFSLTELQFSKTYNDMRTHNGIDIIAETGTVVKPAASGTVHDIFDDLLLGKTVVIEHGDKVYSYYSGLNDVSVKKGDEVSLSKVIGTVGEVPSECMDAPHLHFSIKKGDEYLSPLEFMGLE